MLAGTPSGITLAPEGGAHQSINTPLVGMSTPNLISYEPAYVSELAVLMEWGFQYMQRQNGGKPLSQAFHPFSGATRPIYARGANRRHHRRCLLENRTRP